METTANKEKINSLFFNDPTIVKKPSSSTQSTGGGGNSDAIIKKADSLGLDIVTPGKAIERDTEVSNILNLLNHNENVMLLGVAGTGKTTIAQQISKNLELEGKKLISIPSSFFSSNFAGSSARALESLIATFTAAELKKIVFFMDEIHSVVNMGTFGTGEQDHDTPRNLLKPYLTGNNDKRIVLLGATTTKEYNDKLLERDAAFCRRFQNVEIMPFNVSQMKNILKDGSVIDGFKKSGLEISDSEKDIKKYSQIVDYSCDLLEKYARYRAFPEKGFKFLKNLFAGKNIDDIEQKNIEQLLSRSFHIPLEFITKELNSESLFLDLEERLKNDVIGQNSAIETINEKILGFVSGDPKNPLTFLAVGSTGVGKTQTAENTANMLNLELIKFNMAEYQTPSQIPEFIEKLTNYVRNNYTGVMLFDEIEKANMEALDILLSLTDKGEIGSGADKVEARSQIIFMTSNLIQKTLNECSDVLAEDGIKAIPENILRALIVEETNLRPEFVGRIDSVLHFKNIEIVDRLKISTKLIEQKIESYKKNGITFLLDDNTKLKIAENTVNNQDGVRGQSSAVDDFFDKILSSKKVIVCLKNKIFIGAENIVPNSIYVKLDEGTIKLSVNSTNIVLEGLETVKQVELSDLLKKIKTNRDTAAGTVLDNKRGIV